MYLSRILDNISEQYFAFFQAFPPPIVDLAVVWPAGHENYKTMSNISVVCMYISCYIYSQNVKDDLKLNLA